MLAHPEEIDLFAAAVGDGASGSVGEHLRECDDCRHKLGRLGDVGALLSLALPAVAPPGRLLSNVRSYLRRESFDGFARRTAGLFDLDLATARALLARVRKGDEFSPMVPGMSAMLFDGGPGIAGATCFAACFSAGSRHPRHRHPGAEQVFVLTGAYRDDATGKIVGVGDVGRSEGGSEHGLDVLPERDCIALVLAEGGLPDYLGDS